MPIIARPDHRSSHSCPRIGKCLSPNGYFSITNYIKLLLPKIEIN